MDTGELIIGPPKSRAGLRTVALPRAIIPDLRRHLGNFTGAEDGALIFTGKRGGPPAAGELPARYQVG